ncbi:hypothetical protein Sango_1239000 [Sesamum angolense]|uniref:Uncharacterized protein n=1 Tax=Sesamum angolense TaxID=2727404 RepID=A0AAE1WQG2_9LAMI|nr:hypothetical protein Sango_1239000 [Sesamum angolense]
MRRFLMVEGNVARVVGGGFHHNRRPLPSESPPAVLFPQVDTLHARVENLQKTVREWPDVMGQRAIAAIEEMSILIDVDDVKVENLQAEVNLLKRVVGREEDRAPVSKVKVLDSKPFDGARSAKELENILWDMETYFQTARIPEEKVLITSMYLTRGAKLWWRTHLSDDASENRDKIEIWIEIWDILKKELKDHFLPCNTSRLARESLRKLKHSGTDLPSAIAATNQLVDFRVTSGSEPEKKKKDSGKDKGKDKKFKKNKEVTGSGNKDTAQFSVDRNKKGCYLCKDDHRMQDCPKCGKLNTLVAEADDEGRSSQINPLQLLGAMQEKPPKQRGLLYFRVQINGKVVMAMLDTGATHKFVADQEIQKLGLTLAQHSSRIKAMNSKAKSIQGVVCVDLKVGSRTDKCNLMVVPLDNFDVILRMDFMLLAHAIVMPSLSGLFIVDANCTSFVQGTYLQDFIRSAEKKDTLMSALQEVLDEVAEVLEEFKDVFPPEFPKRLPLHRAIDHAIELQPGARPPAQAPYCMCPAELRSSWMGYWRQRLIQPSKAPYGSPVLFPEKTRWLDEDVRGLSSTKKESLTDHLRHLRVVFQKL